MIQTMIPTMTSEGRDDALLSDQYEGRRKGFYVRCWRVFEITTVLREAQCTTYAQKNPPKKKQLFNQQEMNIAFKFLISRQFAPGGRRLNAVQLSLHKVEHCFHSSFRHVSSKGRRRVVRRFSTKPEFP